MGDLCRICLADKEDLNPIFPLGLEQQRSKQLEMITGNIISHDDGYPQNICADCELNFATAIEFRDTCNRAQEALQNMRNLDLKPEALANMYMEDTFMNQEPESNSDDEIRIDVECDITHNYIPSDASLEEQEAVSKRKKTSPQKIYKKRASNKDLSDHNDISDLKCEKCNKVFTVFKLYKTHMMFHKCSVTCEVCGKKHSSRRALNRHKKSKHSIPKLHKCPFLYCEYESSTKKGLIRHQLNHTGDTPYVCDHCGASFHEKTQLVQHLDTHENKPYPCAICHKYFATKLYVSQHVFKCHREKKYFYECSSCHNLFSNNNSVRRHMVRIHGLTKEQQGELIKVPRNEETTQKMLSRKPGVKDQLSFDEGSNTTVVT